MLFYDLPFSDMRAFQTPSRFLATILNYRDSAVPLHVLGQEFLRDIIVLSAHAHFAFLIFTAMVSLYEKRQAVANHFEWRC